MASDTKIGLLVGLVFIFVIAFIIKGLPSFSRESNNSDLTTDMFSSPNNPPALAIWEREVINRPEVVRKEPFASFEDDVETVLLDDPNIRSVTPFPDIPVAIDQGSGPGVGVEQDVNSVLLGPVMADKTETDKTEGDKAVIEKVEIKSPKPVKSEWPKIYTVEEDDNLATIAKKFYGPEEGNKRANINRIFEANRRFLQSADEINVGQKLIIPGLGGSARSEGKLEDILSSEAFKEVKSIGKRHLFGDVSKAQKTKAYTVREGDNLWMIAAAQLGDGSRFREIAKLNADIVEDEDNLLVGLSLKLPVQ